MLTLHHKPNKQSMRGKVSCNKQKEAKTVAKKPIEANGIAFSLVLANSKLCQVYENELKIGLGC
jgi:hypothetical protein